MSTDQPSRGRPSEPLLDDLGKAIKQGKEAATYLWQVPDDTDTRNRVAQLLAYITKESKKRGSGEMPRLCDELRAALAQPPAPQHAELLQDGFDRLYRLWKAAKSGLMG